MEQAGGIEEAARDWAIRVRDPAFSDWGGLTDWLEADPAHLVAYDAAVDADDWAGALFAAAPAVAAPPRARHRVPRWSFGAVAASVALLAGVGGWVALREHGPQTIATAAGERRVIALDDGSRIVLNGATQVRLGAHAPRDVELLGGEALFEIRHDAAHPFVVRSAGTRLVDAGTVFNVLDQHGRLDVTVGQGAVLYGAGTRQIRLPAGSALSRASLNAEPIVGMVEPKAVGSWNAGFLQYAAAPLAQVASDLSRNLGQPIAPQGDFGSARFTGTLLLDGPPSQVLARTAPLLGVRFAQEGAGWTMMPIDGTAR